MSTPNYYRIQGAPSNAVITAVRTGSITVISGTTEALEFLDLPTDTEAIKNPRTGKQFRRIDDFAEAFVIELEALPDYVPPIAETAPTEPNLEASPEPFSTETDWEETETEAEDATLTIDDVLNSLGVTAEDVETIRQSVTHADSPAPNGMTFVELRKFARSEEGRLKRKVDILATGTIVKGKQLIGTRKVWLNASVQVENALVTKIGSKWLFLKVDGQEYFAKETVDMVYASR